MGLYDFARGFGRAYKRRVGGGGGIITGLFKTTAFQDKLHSSAAKKMLFNFTRSFKLQNLVKNRFHFNTS